jgi:hypothetical protein
MALPVAARNSILLLIFLRLARYKLTVAYSKLNGHRPDIDAAVRGGDWAQRMDGEMIPGDATLVQAIYWTQIYSEILAMEQKVLARIEELMILQSEEGRREVELTNIPVVVAQAERFRRRHGYWETRVRELQLPEPETA